MTMDDLSLFTGKLEADTEQSLLSLDELVQVTAVTIGTHKLLTIVGFDRSPDCLLCLAVYCVAQIANAVQVNLQIRADLLGIDDQDSCEQLLQDVYSVIGKSNEAKTPKQKKWKEDERDPWLFEALSHLCVHLSIRNPDLLPVGTLVALVPMHGKVKKQGLDLVSVYVSPQIGLGIGECKARENNPWVGLQAAADKFQNVDMGNYDPELRTVVGLIRFAVPAEQRNQMTRAFWKEERAYLPIIGYNANHNPQWSSEQDALKELGVPPTHRLLIPLPLQDFRDFFDDLADAMRTYLESLKEEVQCSIPSPGV